jgi:uncharacterized membrane protein YcaP (DUF421 family)
MALRAIIVYVVTLAIVRLGSKRLMGKATAFDVILGIMIGSVMSRGINGSAGLVPTLAGGAVLVALHGLFAVLAYRTSWFGDYVKGRPVLLVEDGRVRPEGMRAASLTERRADQRRGERPRRPRIGGAGGGQPGCTGSTPASPRPSAAACW